MLNVCIERFLLLKEYLGDMPKRDEILKLRLASLYDALVAADTYCQVIERKLHPAHSTTINNPQPFKRMKYKEPTDGNKSSSS